MVRQMLGEYRVKDAGLKAYFAEVQKRLKNASFTFEIKHVNREDNSEADDLANRAINLKRNVML